MSRWRRSSSRPANGCGCCPARVARIRETLGPLFEVYADFERFIDDLVRQFGRGPGVASQTVTVETPNSLLQIIATSAPFAIIQMFFAVLVIYFFLAGWTRMRKQTITGRQSFDGAMTTARVIQQVVDATSTYLGTITLVNISMGLVARPRALSDRHGIAFDVGRHRRGAELHPLSGADRRRLSCSRSAG